MPTRNVNLTEHYDRFVDSQLKAGTFKNASEVLRAGLRLLEQQREIDSRKLALLKKLAQSGFESLDQGEGIVVSGEKALTQAIAKIGRRAAKSAGRRRTS